MQVSPKSVKDAGSTPILPNASSPAGKKPPGKGKTTAFHFLPGDAFYRTGRGRDQHSGPEDVLPLVIHATRAAAGFLFYSDADAKGEIDLDRDKTRWLGAEEVAGAMGTEVEKLAVRAIEGAKPVWRFAKMADQKFLAVAVPVVIDQGVSGCLAMAIPNAKAAQGNAISAVIQGYGSWFLYADVSQNRHKETWLFEKVAALIEVSGTAAAAEDVKEATGLIADQMREVMGCTAVALVSKKRTRYELASVSGGLEIEQRSEGSTALEACVADSVRRKETFVREPGNPAENDQFSGTIHEVARIFNATGWVVAPLERDGEVAGGWIFLWADADNDFAEKERLLKAANPQVAPLLKFIQKAKPDGFRALVSRVWKRMTSSHKKLFLGIVGGLLAVGLFPAKERIAVQCEMQPSVRRVIAAPFDGTLHKSIGEAGDVVTEGQVLAEMDGREIRFQLAEAIANRARATKEADRAMDAGKVAESQMAELESHSYEQQQMLLEERRQNLEIKSPIAGLVLQGDLERAEGAPLRMGDRLFEVAPIDEMLVELEVPESEIAFVKEGMKVKFKLEAHHGETFEVTIEKVAPRTEIRGDRNVFVCQAKIENAVSQLRPGMKGAGKVYSERRPIVWSLIRPAVNWVRLKMWL